MKTRQFNLRQAPAARALSLACATAFATFNASAVHAQSSASTLVQLPTVVVTANRMEQALQTAPIGATVLLGDDIRASGVLDANEAVRKLGGVNGRTDLYGGREFSIDLRGYGEAASQNLVVVVDGIRITQIDLASARLSSIAPEMIERIEIIRGGASVMWGEGAAGGVISVTTKAAVKKGLQGSVSVGLESFKGRDVQASVGVAGKTADVSIDARKYQTDGYRDNSANEQTTYSLNGGFKLGDLKARASFSSDKQDSRLPGALSTSDFLSIPTSTQSPNDFGLVNEKRSNINIVYRLNDWQILMDVGQRDRKTSSEFYGANSSTSQNTQFSPRVIKDTEAGGILLTTVLGFDKNRAKADNLVNNEAVKQESNAWFLSSDVLLASQTRLSIGARVEDFKKSGVSPANSNSYSFKDNLSAWNLGVNQTLAQGLDLYGRASKSYRLPNVDENRSPSGQPPQPQIRPSIAKDLELGVKWTKGKNNASVRAFKQTSVDEIAYLYPYNVNQDDIKRTGFEVEGGVDYGNGWDASVALQNIAAKFTNGANAGKDVPLVSKLTLTARVGYAFDAQNRVEVSAQHRSASFPGGDTANVCNAEKVPSTTYLNALYNFTASGVGKGWTMTAGVNNLTGKSSYSYAYPYLCSGGIYPDAGRSFSLRAKYAF